MYARAFVLSSLFLGLARADNAFDACAQSYKYSKNRNITVNMNQDCNEKPCITKCCPGDSIILTEADGKIFCANFTYLEEKYKFKPNYSLVKIHNKDIKERDAILTENKIDKHFVLLFNPIFFDVICSKDLAPIYLEEEWYILEDGKLVRRAFNHANQWFDTYNVGEFCVELKAYEGALDMSKDPEIVIYLKNRDETALKNTTKTRAIVNASGMLVSSVFMALVLLVYALLPELHNLMGLMLMAYLAASIAFFLVRSTHYFASTLIGLDPPGCSVMTLLFYYSLLSSFAWLNVMSFDIWWTLRRSVPVAMNGKLDRDRKGRRHVPKQFWWYNLHGWGTPLVFTVFAIVVDLVDLRQIPSFVKPHFIHGNSCFIGPDEYWRYVTMPLMTLTSVNVVMFVMTAVRIWLIRRNVEAIGSTNKNTGFKTYVTLSLVMGITWMFEPLSEIVARDSWLWYILDAYNLFAGFFLFVLLVCKKNVVLSLCKKYSIDNAFVRKLRASDPQSSFATDCRRGTHSTVCATTSVEVNAHPAGDKELNKKP